MASMMVRNRNTPSVTPKITTLGLFVATQCRAQKLGYSDVYFDPEIVFPADLILDFLQTVLFIIYIVQLCIHFRYG